jgi:hypothetical protein
MRSLFERVSFRIERGGEFGFVGFNFDGGSSEKRGLLTIRSVGFFHNVRRLTESQEVCRGVSSFKGVAFVEESNG